MFYYMIWASGKRKRLRPVRRRTQIWLISKERGKMILFVDEPTSIEMGLCFTEGGPKNVQGVEPVPQAHLEK